MKHVYVLVQIRRARFRWWRRSVKIIGVYATLDAALNEFRFAPWEMDGHGVWVQDLNHEFRVVVTAHTLG